MRHPSAFVASPITVHKKAVTLLVLVTLIACFSTSCNPSSQKASFKPLSTADERTWVTNGAILDIETSGNTTYIAGDFTQVGPNTGHGVPLDLSTGSPVASYPKVNGYVYACVTDGSGGWYIGGNFTKVGAITRNNIAHIFASGTVDTTWNPDASGGMGDMGTEVRTLAVSGSIVYVGGDFSSIGGRKRKNIAAIDTTTGQATSWNPDAINIKPVSSGSVFALAVSSSTVYAGGLFSNIGGQERNCIAAIDADTGKATSWNPDAIGGELEGPGSVSAIAVSGSTVYVGGGFSSIGGKVRSNIAAIDASTGKATPWNPNAMGYEEEGLGSVSAIAVSGSTVYAGGDFYNIAGQERNNIAAIDASTGKATAWNPDAIGGEQEGFGSVSAIAVSSSMVYVGGGFYNIGGQERHNIAAIDTSTGKATAWNPNADSVVYSLAVSGSSVYAGGEFCSMGGTDRHYIAAIADKTGMATDWNPGSNGAVWTLAVGSSTVYAVGGFSSIGGKNRRYIAEINAVTGKATDWNPGADGGVETIAVNGSTVYVGGGFSRIGGKDRDSIAAIDASTGKATSWNPDVFGGVSAIAVKGSVIYVGGDFSSIGVRKRNNIAAIDNKTGKATDWNPGADGGVGTLAVSGSTVYARGGFRRIGGKERNYIAAIDASTGKATDWNPNVDGGVSTLAVNGATVYVGGGFQRIGGKKRNYIAGIDASTGKTTDWNPNVDGYVRTLAVNGSAVCAGGEFGRVGGKPASNFARFITATVTPAP